MPRLSDYLKQQQEEEEEAHQPSTGAALSAELARLQLQHANRVRQHGPRVYRQADGTLSQLAPTRQPYTVVSDASDTWGSRPFALQQLNTSFLHCRPTGASGTALSSTADSSRE